MVRDRIGRRLSFLSSQVDDPRRIQLRESRFIEAYHRRGGGGTDLVEAAHDLTKLRRTDAGAMLDSMALFQQSPIHPILYTEDPEFPLQPRTRLPEPVIPDRPFVEIVWSRRSCRTFERHPLTSSELSSLLFGAIGETSRLTVCLEDSRPLEASLRSIPSGGALHPTRIFAVLLQDGEPPPGVYHYYAPEHSLELVKPLAEPVKCALFGAVPVHPDVVDLTQASAIFFVTTKFWRPRAKYGPRGYRYCLQEAGAACQNLSLTCVALGLAHVVLGGFYDDEVHECLEIDGVDHAVVTAIAVGAPPAQSEEAPRHVDY